jgi:type II secretory pathway component PulC
VTYAKAPLTEAHQSHPPANLSDLVSLIGTAIVNPNGHGSVAVLEDKKTQTQLAIVAGETVYGSIIKRIQRQYVTYAVQGKEYRLYTSEGMRDASQPQPETSPFEPLFRTATTKTFKISQDAIDHTRADLHGFLRQSTFYPFYRDGKIDGFMIRGIQKESFLEKIGFQENDIIQHVEGHPITAMDDWIKVNEWIQQKDQMEVGLLRDGRALIFEYQIVKEE